MNLSRRNFLKRASILGAGAFAGASFAGSSSSRPNIIWLICEDMSPDLACYGNSVVKTPNIDALAQQGRRYDRVYCTAPVCSANRSALFTSMYQTTLDAQDHRSHRDDGYILPSPARVITNYFRDEGYYTSCGRWDNTSSWGKGDWNWQSPTHRDSFDGTDFSGRAQGQPFFAQISFSLTHRSADSVQNPQNPISGSQIELPPTNPEHPLTRKDWSNYLEKVQKLDSQVGSVLSRIESEGLAENTIIFFFSDHGRPQIWDKQWLYEGGLRIPLIIRWPGEIPEGSVSDELISTIDLAPTAMKWAGIDVPGHFHGMPFSREGRRLVYDSASFSLGLASQTAGRNYAFAARDKCGASFDRIRAVITKRYKYIRNFYPERPYTNNPGQTMFNRYIANEYPVNAVQFAKYYQGSLEPAQLKFMETAGGANRPAEELYDLQNDPWELNNLAANPQHQRIRDHLSRRLDRWIVETGDMGEYPPDDLNVGLNWGTNNFYSTLEARGVDTEPFKQGRYQQGWENYLAYWENVLL
ncbi:Arylsulfatase [Sedimentisphaera cyanobacteriorum]|uniref:Arylsulfatase n=1 Tax=Sedimentisphaera cyanobacteriorum TaxID=1940790 RepID=A0A1Q2HM53_9BACT|nr:sulfatase [Sedimentisphaera cyanobacteriorum]AQQ08538.1 Arylsulfatase [Sedimentisphaera cyanobacteriorum]